MSYTSSGLLTPFNTEGPADRVNDLEFSEIGSRKPTKTGWCTCGGRIDYSKRSHRIYCGLSWLAVLGFIVYTVLAVYFTLTIRYGTLEFTKIVINPQKSCLKDRLPMYIELKLHTPNSFGIRLNHVNLGLTGFSNDSIRISKDIANLNFQFAENFVIRSNKDPISVESFLEIKEFELLADFLAQTAEFTPLVADVLLKASFTSWIYAFPMTIPISRAIAIAIWKDSSSAGTKQTSTRQFQIQPLDFSGKLVNVHLDGSEIPKLEVSTEILAPQFNVWLPPIAMVISRTRFSDPFLTIQSNQLDLVGKGTSTVGISVNGDETLTSAQTDDIWDMIALVSSGNFQDVFVGFRSDNFEKDCILFKILEQMPRVRVPVSSLLSRPKPQASSLSQVSLFSVSNTESFIVSNDFLEFSCREIFIQPTKISRQYERALIAELEVSVLTTSSFSWEMLIPPVILSFEYGLQEFATVSIDFNSTSKYDGKSQYHIALRVLPSQESTLLKVARNASVYLPEVSYRVFGKSFVHLFFKGSSRLMPESSRPIEESSSGTPKKSSPSSFIKGTHIYADTEPGKSPEKNLVVSLLAQMTDIQLNTTSALPRILFQMAPFESQLFFETTGQVDAELSMFARVYMEAPLEFQVINLNKKKRDLDHKILVVVDSDLETGVRFSQAITGFLFRNNFGSLYVKPSNASPSNFTVEFSDVYSPQPSAKATSKYFRNPLEFVYGVPNNEKPLPFNVNVRPKSGETHQFSCAFMKGAFCPSNSPQNPERVITEATDSVRAFFSISMKDSVFMWPFGKTLDTNKHPVFAKMDMEDFKNLANVRLNGMYLRQEGYALPQFQIDCLGGFTSRGLEDAVDSFFQSNLFRKGITSFQIEFHSVSTANMLSSIMSNFTIGLFKVDTTEFDKLLPPKEKVVTELFSYYLAESSSSNLKIQLNLFSDIPFMRHVFLNFGSTSIRVSSNDRNIASFGVSDLVFNGNRSTQFIDITVFNASDVSNLISTFMASLRDDNDIRVPIEIEVSGFAKMKFPLSIDGDGLLNWMRSTFRKASPSSSLDAAPPDISASSDGIQISNITQGFLDSVIGNPVSLIAKAIQGAVFQQNVVVDLSGDLPLWNPTNISAVIFNVRTTAFLNDPDGVPWNLLLPGSPYQPKLNQQLFTMFSTAPAVMGPYSDTKPYRITGQINLGSTLQVESLVRLYNEYFGNQRLCLNFMFEAQLKMMGILERSTEYILPVKTDFLPLVKLLFLDKLPPAIASRIVKPCPDLLHCIPEYSEQFETRRLGSFDNLQFSKDASRQGISGNIEFDTSIGSLPTVMLRKAFSFLDGWESRFAVRFLQTGSHSQALVFGALGTPSSDVKVSSCLSSCSSGYYRVTSPDPKRGFWVMMHSHRNGSMKIFSQVGEMSPTYVEADFSRLFDSEWHQVTLHYDPSASSLSIFIDQYRLTEFKVSITTSGLSAGSGFAFVSGAGTAPSKSSIELANWGMFSAVTANSGFRVITQTTPSAGSEFQLSIAAFSSCGPRLLGGDSFKVSFVRTSPQDVISVGAQSILDLSNGKYLVQAKIPRSGNYNVVVEFRREKTTIATVSVI